MMCKDLQQLPKNESVCNDYFDFFYSDSTIFWSAGNNEKIVPFKNRSLTWKKSRNPVFEMCASCWSDDGSGRGFHSGIQRFKTVWLKIDNVIDPIKYSSIFCCCRHETTIRTIPSNCCSFRHKCDSLACCRCRFHLNSRIAHANICSFSYPCRDNWCRSHRKIYCFGHTHCHSYRIHLEFDIRHHWPHNSPLTQSEMEQHMDILVNSIYVSIFVTRQCLVDIINHSPIRWGIEQMWWGILNRFGYDYDCKYYRMHFVLFGFFPSILNVNQE